MNSITRYYRLAFILIVFATVAHRAPAIVFTGDTYIGPSDTSYDGQDLVILDCTVTVDGPHTFSSLVLAANGVLTHSFSTNGQIPAALTVSNAPYVLSGTLPYLLANSNIFSPILVTDTNGDIYTNGADYLAIPLLSGDTELFRTTNSSIPDGGTVLVSYSYYGIASAGLDLMVTGVVWVTTGCEIDADGIGYGAGFGPGAGKNSSNMFFFGSGGGYGGSGGMSLSNAVGGVCYDSLYQPSLPGSGGGSSYAGTGGNGGGLVRITAGGEVVIDGVISANGENATNSRSGGGSGGGISISAPSISGAGIITANGGLGAPDYGGGGGGGGRIALDCNTNNFSGTITAYGGGGANNGGSGTIFTELTSLPGLLTLNNNGNPGANSTVTLSSLTDLAVSNGAVVAVYGTFLPQNLTIGTNGVLTGQLQTRLQFSVSNLTINVGGAMSVNGLGYLNSGSVAGTYASGGVTYGGGGGHGGFGGAAAVTNAFGGAVNDSQPNPLGLGTPGGGGIIIGGAGGGAINVNVTGTLLVNGLISANGSNGNGLAGGGGAGGSVFLTAGTVSGNGTVTANGGSGANLLGGGGGGGRIAIVANTYTYSGIANCFGGGGANYGGAGTVYSSQNSGWQNLVLDNGGNTGSPTPLQEAGGANLFVQNGAWGTLPASSTFASLLVTSNAWVTTPPNFEATAVTILSNAMFQAGGGLTLNSDGPRQSTYGTGGSAFTTPYPGGGGGNGGAGGVGSLPAPFQGGDTGGAAGFNPVANPFYAGGTGGGDSPYSIGGTGGGTLRLIVDGTLQVNGAIMANGGNGSGEGGGGGAGGSLNLSATIFAGSGSITANGGNGVDSTGGGGGGGCIAITFNTNGFNGTLSAFGGTGANNGGAGTIYFKTNSFINGQIIVDNGGVNGANSVIASLQGTPDLTVRNNSVLSYISFGTISLSFGNVLITNASLVVSNSSTVINANNIFLQNGGRLIADRGGFGPGAGPGAGKFGQAYQFAGSGGGNGGCGGAAISNSVAGGTAGFEPYTQATEAGSGGGGERPYSIGGNGGGSIQLNVSGTLALNGALSANGGDGGGSGGGGAGGSLQLDIGSLTGTGSMSANGGSGASGQGGGGGGGMIDVTFEQSIFSNLFSGTITAYGGGGWTNGGAGTIFIKTNITGQATLIVDNGGNLGTNTPITTSSSLYSIMVRNGAVAALPDFSESFSSLLITSNAWLVPNVPQPGALGEVNLTLQGNATIQAGGGIIADSDGYAQNLGPGHGLGYSVSPTYPGSGGGHGGDGAFSISNLIAGGMTYDSITVPTQQGSGGGGIQNFSTGGAGGGLVNLNLINGGILQMNGLISANGGNGSGSGGGGGSGGSINLMAGVISGTGSIRANGGAGAPNGGGGGGGCIALGASGKVVGPPLGNAGTNIFLGTISAYGGGGANYGGAGTLFYQTNINIGAPSGGRPELYVDNGGNVGTNTTLNVGSVSGVNVVIQNGGIGAIPASPWVPGDVMVLSNGTLTSLIPQTTVQPMSLTIATGGVFSVDGVGYAAQTGPGAGSTSGGISGGGGHGGYGGGNALPGGNAYDSIQLPAIQGSGGANSSVGPGGAGGGALTVRTLHDIVVNGRISANGRAGGLNAGGGAGGSISLLASLGTMYGNGIISANGGAGMDSGGGGAGGRLAVPIGLFTGQFSASGGAGSAPGGAGTIFTLTGGQKLIINNGGLIGAGTPLSTAVTAPTTPFELDISGGASVVPFTPLPLLSNLNVLASSTLTMPVVQSNFTLAVMGNATIAGDLDVDSLGYSLGNGPGAGVAIDNDGSGGGYGGAGGASDSGAHGGGTYGSAPHPTDFGSGGGNGADTTSGGSEGGGALRLSVSGTLNVNGNVSANGDTGLQDDSGGGSGGSVWITAGTLSGAGTISAAGGDGVLYGGGGGGGGRIAIYTVTNQFTGTTNVSGGLGIFSGQPGTVSLGSALNGMQILSQSPTGLVMNTVSSVNLMFSDMLNVSTVIPADFTLITPAETLPSISVLVTSPYTVQVSFPTQNLVGTYTIQVATGIVDVFGGVLAQPYSGTFTVSLPTISGTVTGTNSAGVAGVSMQASGGLIAATTDTNGNYSLGVPPGWTGTVTPSFGANAFVPGSTSYVNVTSSFVNQNYSMVSTIAPALTTSLSAGNCCLNWNGISGVTYQVLWSTNLVTWQPLGSPFAGTNGPMQMILPCGTNCMGFFQLQASP